MQLRPGEPPRLYATGLLLLLAASWPLATVGELNRSELVAQLVRTNESGATAASPLLGPDEWRAQQPPLEQTSANQTQLNAQTSAQTRAQNELKQAEQESMSFPFYMRLIATLACLIIFTVGVAGNLLVPLVVIKTRYLRNSTNLFLINLSIADLLVLIVCMPTVLIELHSRPETWLLGEAMCKYLMSCRVVPYRASELRRAMSAKAPLQIRPAGPNCRPVERVRPSREAR